MLEKAKLSHAHERLGFFNARLCQRMNEVNLSTTELARRVDLTYEQVRKLILGHCLPSPIALKRLCVVLTLNRRDMSERVARDKAIFKFGDLAWNYWGIDPRAGPLYILFPLLNTEEQEMVRLWIIAFVEAKKRSKALT